MSEGPQPIPAKSAPAGHYERAVLLLPPFLRPKTNWLLHQANLV